MPTNPTVISRSSATAGPGGGNADRFVPEIRDMILMYGPNINPLTLISSKSKKRTVGNPTYKVMHDKQLPRYDRINNGAGYSNSATSLVVDNGSYFRANDLVRNTRTGEIFLVTAVSTNTLTAVRGYDSGAAGTGVAMLDNDELMIIGNSMSERAAAPSVLITDPTTVTNYIQRFGRVTGLSVQREHTKEYGPKEAERQKKAAMIEFKKDIEYAFKFGKPLNDVEGASPLDSAVSDSRRQTGGLQYWIDNYASANVLDAGGVITQNQLWDFVEPMFKDYPEDTTDQQFELMALCSPKAFQVFHNWGIPVVRISEKTKNYGLALQTYQTPVGRLSLAQDYTLQGDEYNDWMFVINPSDLEYVCQQGLDMQLKTDIQNNDVHEKKDELFGYLGFGMGRPELHGYIKNMQLAA